MPKNYRLYNTDNKVIAVSTYAGKPVRGIAKCDPCDTFSYEDGRDIAIARCNEKIAEKRYKRATKKFDEARKALNDAEAYYNKMYAYYQDSAVSLGDARLNTLEVISRVAP